MATLIAFIILGFSTMAVAFKYFKFELGIASIIKSAIASVVMVCAILLFNPAGIVQTIVAITIGIIIYFTLILILKVINKNELDSWKNLLRLN